MHHPYFKVLTPARQALVGANPSVLPWRINQLAASYGFPLRAMPGGGVIGIVELGGGYTPDDIGRFFGSLNMPLPAITNVSVDTGAGNSPGQEADIEVLLDIMIAGAVYSYCTGQAATVRVYFANNDSGGITRAIMKAVDDGCDTCSISWGSNEANWGSVAAQDLEVASAGATARGMTIFAASGDNDSSDLGPGSSNVDLPAAAPDILGCGGTRRPHNSSATNPETVWNLNPGNSNGEGTGGGFSMYFPKPTWQAGVPGMLRMVPDVAACADPTTGVHIVFMGQDIVVGGTSVVAPFFAGAIASVGPKLGFISRKLWMHPEVFYDIVPVPPSVGASDNGKYSASVGPDPVTGLGTPRGAKLFALLGTQ